MAKSDAPKNADFVARLVTDPKEPPQTRIHIGWFGDSAEEGHRRIYTEPDLSNWVDVPTDAILYSEEFRNAQPAGCVMVWVKADAAVQQSGDEPVDNQSGFAEAVGDPPGPAITRFGPVCTTRLRPNCPPTLAGPRCPTPNGPACPTPNGPVCPTQQGPRCPTAMGPPCPTPGCPTNRPRCTQFVCQTEQQPRCQTNFGPRCPSIAEICTQFGPECPTVPPLDCTVAPACHTGGVQCTGNPCIRIDVDPTPVTMCFICPPKTQHEPNCPVGQEAIAFGGGQFGAGAQGPVGPTGFQGCMQPAAWPTFPPQCPPPNFTVGWPQCVTMLGCPQPPVWTQIGQHCASAVDACPTRFCG